MHSLDGQRESGRTTGDGEDNMSKGTKVGSSGSGRRTVKALNSRAEIVGLRWRDLI